MNFIVLKKTSSEKYIADNNIYIEYTTVEYEGTKSICKNIVSDLENKVIYLKDLLNVYSSDDFEGKRIFSITAKVRAGRFLEKMKKSYKNTIIQKEVNRAIDISKKYDNNLYHFNEHIKNALELIKGDYFITEAIHINIH